MNGKIGNSEQLCSVMRTELIDGRGKGLRLVHVSNGRLNFVLSESNALDILRLWHRGTNIGFLTKNGISNSSEDFLQTFPGGMLYTCGLDALGLIEGHPLHGRMHSQPAAIEELKADEKGVRIVAVARQSSFFGENLVLTRAIETSVDSDEITLTDELRNCAFRDEKYCMLYHVNLGYPMIDVGARLAGNFVESRPRNEWAAKSMKTVFEIEPPVDNYEEMCYFHRTKDGLLTVTNRKLGKRFTLKSTLKRIVQWKSRGSGDFALGLEPCTCWLDDEFHYAVIKKGGKVVNRLSLKIEDI